MSQKIEKVTTMGDYKLLISFSDGTTKVYNAAHVAEKNVDVRIPTLWNSVKVAKDGLGVTWINGVKLPVDDIVTE